MAHELSHLLCGEDSPACRDEAAIDRTAIGLLLRDPNIGASIANYQAMSDTLNFVSLFGDQDTLVRMSVDEALARREILRRRGLAACMWSEAFDKMADAPGGLAAAIFDRVRTTDPQRVKMMEAAFAGMRAQVQLYCSLVPAEPGNDPAAPRG